MSVQSVLDRGREVRKKLMRSRVRIVRRNDDRTFNPATGFYEGQTEELIYEGPCHFKPTQNPAERDMNSGSREVVIRSYEVVLPWGDGSVNVESSDIAFLLDSDDKVALERELPVGEIQLAGDRTARHIVVWEYDRGVRRDG